MSKLLSAKGSAKASPQTTAIPLLACGLRPRGRWRRRFLRQKLAQPLFRHLSAGSTILGKMAWSSFETFASFLTTIPLARQHLLIDVNIKGVLNGCYLAFPYLQKTANSRVINLCSASALYGQPSLAVYSATKFAVRGLTEALDLEWASEGIRVMDVLPLFVQTDMITQMNASSIKNMGVHLTSQDVANTILQASQYKGYLPKVHWTVGKSTRFFYAVSGVAPDLISRTINQFITRSH